jgi:hypothetical protein
VAEFRFPFALNNIVCGYCTVNVILVEPSSFMLIALTVTVLVPVGVPCSEACCRRCY